MIPFITFSLLFSTSLFPFGRKFDLWELNGSRIRKFLSSFVPVFDFLLFFSLVVVQSAPVDRCRKSLFLFLRSTRRVYLHHYSYQTFLSFSRIIAFSFLFLLSSSFALSTLNLSLSFQILGKKLWENAKG